MKVGVLGGVFNPLHSGHLAVARAALEQLKLDLVLLVPTGQAPHREIEGDPGAEARLELVREAVADEERIEVSAIEVERAGPSYTLETLEQLASERPEDELVLILGADQAAKIESWHEPRRVVAAVSQVAVAPRPGAAMQDAAAALERLGADKRLEVLDMEPLDVSSTELRERATRSEGLTRRLATLAAGKGATDLVVLDLRELLSYTDFLVICTARNERLARAIHDEVVVSLKQEGHLAAHVEGEAASRWIVTDYLDCVLHVFTPEARDYYRLDQLWGEAPQLALDAMPVSAGAA